MNHISLHAAEAEQLTPAAARVVDPINTEAVRGYRHPGHIADFVFPRVNTTARGGTRIEFDRTDFRKVNARRAPGAATRRVQFGRSGAKYALEQHRLEGTVPVEVEQEAARVGLDEGMVAAQGVMAMISLNREIDAGEKVANAANYKTGLVTTLSGTAQWDDYAHSTPTKNVMAALNAVRGQIGMRPNVVALGASVYYVVSAHPEILKQLVYRQPQAASPQDLATIWRVDNVVVGDAIYVDDADASHDVWGDVVWVGYARTGPASRAEPTWGFGYQLAGTPLAEEAYLDRNTSSWQHPACHEWSNEVVGKDAAYLYKDVLST